MIEVILLGLILEVDPFDQPNVEDYKSGMREYLKK
jgi:glucose-6-phosphate isomerase